MRMNRSFLRISFILSCLIVLLVLTGCSSSKKMSTEEKAANGIYPVYYKNPEGNALIHDDYQTKSEAFDGILQEVLTEFAVPTGTNRVTAIPESVTINAAVPGINEIDVDFSSEYLSLDSITEVMLRAALTNTLLGLPGVDAVRFTVDSQPLTIGDAEIGAMDVHTFIIPENDAINSYRTETLKLYFPNKDCSMLHLEQRWIYYSTNVNTARMVVEQLIKGPANSEMIAVMTPDVLVRNVEIKGGICTVDLSPEFNQEPGGENPVDPEVALYAITDSIIDSCENDHISGVQFLIDGSRDIRFRNQVNLDQVFARNADLLQTKAKETEQQA